MYYKLMFSLASCLAIVVSSAQDPTDVVSIQDRFEASQPAQWMHTFSGLWDNLHPVQLTLAFNGKEYHGTFQALSDKTVFDVEGDQENGQIRLHEIDPDGRTSGYIIGGIEDGRFVAKWWSVDFSRAANLVLRNEEIVELRKFQPELILLEGMIGSDKIRMTVQREETDMVSGYGAFIGDESYYKLNGRCVNSTCDGIEFVLNSADGINYGLKCTKSRSATYKAVMTEPDESTRIGTLNQEVTFPMVRKLYSAYTGNIDCLYPTLSMPGFDTWLSGQFETWFSRSRSFIDSLESLSGTPGPSLRWYYQASAWVDFTLVTPETVSGIVTMYSLADQQYKRHAFIFDTRSGKLEEVGDMGKKVSFESELYADATELRVMGSDEPEYLAWVDRSPFDHIALSWDGFIVFTDFDPFYGDTWVKLKYADYSDDLKRNATVFDLED